MQVVEIVFEELKRQGIVFSGRDFSEDWLGMEGSYFRAVRTKHRTASVKAVATCAAKLRRRADALRHSSMPQVQAQAADYNALADRCLSEVLSACESRL